MRRIYDFECTVPPLLTESLLRARAEERRLRRRTALAAAGGLLMQTGAALLIFAALVGERGIILAAAYLGVSLACGAAVAVVFKEKEGVLIK